MGRKRGRAWCWVTPVAVLALGVVAVGGIASVMAQAKPIKIGFSMALTGSVAAAGKAALIAMKIWMEDVNGRGGLLGRPVELVYYDDQSKLAQVPAIYMKLIAVDKVDFVVSPASTLMTAPAMPIVIEHKMVFPSLFALAVNTGFNYKYYFQIMPVGPEPYENWSKGFFAVAARQNPKPETVALVGIDHEYGANALVGAAKNAQAAGFRIVYDKRYPPATTDFTPVVRAIKALNPDVVYVSSYPPDSVGMVKAAREVGLRTKIFGGGMVGLQYTSIQEGLGPTLNGIVNFAFWVPEPTLKFPGIEAFLKKYQARASQEGTDALGFYLPPFAYAYVQILGQAIEATKSLDQAAVGEYIRAKEFETVVGKVRFGANGEWAQARILHVQFQGIQSKETSEFAKSGKMVVLDPPEYKSDDIVYPFRGWQ
jgi:branched-chain amino acid transport system substrate-binding protein